MGEKNKGREKEREKIEENGKLIDNIFNCFEDVLESLVGCEVV